MTPENDKGAVDAPVNTPEKPAAAPDGGGVQEPQQDNPAAADTPAGPYRPDGLADHLFGESDQATIDKLMSAYKGARDELAGKHKMPKSLEEYQVPFTPEQAEKFLQKNEDGVDPVYDALRKAAFDNGIAPEKALGFVSEIYEQALAMAENKDEVAQASAKLDFDFSGFGGQDKAKPLLDANGAWIDGLKNQGVIDDNDAEEMRLHLEYSEGLRWLDKLRVHAGEKPIPVSMNGGPVGDGPLTKAQLDEMVRDPRYWKTKDKDFIAQVTAGFSALYGAQNAS